MSNQIGRLEKVLIFCELLYLLHQYFKIYDSCVYFIWFLKPKYTVTNKEKALQWHHLGFYNVRYIPVQLDFIQGACTQSLDSQAQEPRTRDYPTHP